MTQREQRLLYTRYRTQYERQGRRIFEAAVREILADIPWGRLTRQNYVRVIRTALDEAIFQRAFAEFYRYVVSTQTRRSLRLFERLGADQKHIKNALTSDLVAAILSDILRSAAGKKIRTMTRRLANTVIEIIAQTYGEGARSFADAVKEAQRLAGKRGFYKWQTRRIVRTETTFAANYSQFRAAEKAKILLKKRWITVLDKRTREHERGDLYDHWDMDGVEVAMREHFKVENREGGVDKLLFPGDQRIIDGDAPDPSNTINCRCTCAYFPVLRNGRIVPNPNAQ